MAPSQDYLSGIVYAIMQLDSPPSGGEVMTTRLIEREDGKFDVAYKTTFPLPPRTQEKIAEVMKTLAGIGEVKFEDFPITRH
jgi:hypothetical protein